MLVRKLTMALAAVAAGAFVVFGTVPVADAQAEEAAPVGFGVSAPGESAKAKPGEEVETWLGVSNQFDEPLTLGLRLVELHPLDAVGRQYRDPAAFEFVRHHSAPAFVTEASRPPEGGGETRRPDRAADRAGRPAAPLFKAAVAGESRGPT